MFPVDYFPPTYFTASYFAAPATVGPSPAALEYRDRDAFAAIAAALSATGELAAVSFAKPLDSAPIGGDRMPLAVVVPVDWREIDDADGARLFRHVTYTVTLVVRDEDAAERFQRLDRLTSQAQNAIEGSDLGGGCLRALTRLRAGRYDPKSPHPEQHVVLTGAFTYIVSPPAGHSTSP